jgi:Ala-tRNA(Pro) deacylase
MAIALTLKQFLDDQHVPYDVLVHTPTMTARHTARCCEIEADRLAKAVLMRDRQGYVMAVLPASCRLDKAQLWRLLHRSVEFADEDEAQSLLRDCIRGAIPALGQAYGIETVVDDRLDRAPEVWVEAGDHERLVHLSGESFRQLMAGARHGSFAHA